MTQRGQPVTLNAALTIERLACLLAGRIDLLGSRREITFNISCPLTSITWDKLSMVACFVSLGLGSLFLNCDFPVCIWCWAPPTSRSQRLTSRKRIPGSRITAQYHVYATIQLQSEASSFLTLLIDDVFYSLCLQILLTKRLHSWRHMFLFSPDTA